VCVCVVTICRHVSCLSAARDLLQRLGTLPISFTELVTEPEQRTEKERRDSVNVKGTYFIDLYSTDEGFAIHPS
jgi:hypothetical protein